MLPMNWLTKTLSCIWNIKAHYIGDLPVWAQCFWLPNCNLNNCTMVWRSVGYSWIRIRRKKRKKKKEILNSFLISHCKLVPSAPAMMLKSSSNFLSFGPEETSQKQKRETEDLSWAEKISSWCIKTRIFSSKQVLQPLGWRGWSFAGTRWMLSKPIGDWRIGFQRSKIIRPPRPILPWNRYVGFEPFSIGKDGETIPAAANLSGSRGLVNSRTGSCGSCVNAISKPQ